MEIILDENQQKAVDLCTDLSNRIVAVTGEAGTGKTTIIKLVYNNFIDYINEHKEKFTKLTTVIDDYKFNAEDYIAVVAPTGKAAKRIEEATGIPAMTIHRLLEYPMPGDIDEKTGKPLSTSTPKRDRNNPIRQKIVICDEYAMVSYEVHRNLIDALPRGGVVRMFGDCNQLEPIEESKLLIGKPSQFQEMLAKFPSVVLNHIHRQDDGSNIITNAHKINFGIMPLRTDDFVINYTSDRVLPTQIIEELIKKDSEYYTVNKQILSPSRKSWIGTDKLNLMIQMQRFCDRIEQGFPIERHNWDKSKDFCLFIGDKVIFTKNNYDLGVFNGESGIVTDIKLYGNVTIDFGDRIVDIPPTQTIQYYSKMIEYNPQKDISLAYVITTHKAQGSEYDEITYILDRSVIYNSSRKNLYTAITRAKKKVNIITDQRTFIFALKHKYNPYTMKGGTN